MRALLYENFDRLVVSEIAPPVPADDEVLLKVSACGICGSELESFKSRSPRRPPPIVMGHEFCGVIASGGLATDGFRAGDRVVSNSLVTCGHCASCRRGDDHLCAERQLFGMNRPGAFAEYVAVPARNLIRWPAQLAREEACLAEPLANGVHVVGLTANLEPKTVLVIGAGPIGLLTQQAFQALTPARVMVADLNSERLRMAAQLRAARVVDAGKEDLIAAVQAMTDGEGVDLAVDAVGSEGTKRQSLAAARRGGAVVWIGLSQDEVRISSHQVTIREVTVMGTYGARLAEVRVAVDLLASGSVVSRPWIKAAPLADGVGLFRRMLAARDDDIKGVVFPE